MREWQQRTHLLMGEEKIQILSRANVLVVGLGGVGAYAAEMICRAGVGRMTIIDADQVVASNINRQMVALHSTIGKSKVEVLADRFRDINPELVLTVVPRYLYGKEDGAIGLENADETIDFDISGFSFIVDAIDTIGPKLTLITAALRQGVPIVSSMGAGAKRDITKIQFADIRDTYHCGLSKAVRNGLKKARLHNKKLPVVFCSEQTDRGAVVKVEGERNKKTTAGTVSYMPATFGCYLAQHVIEKL